MREYEKLAEARYFYDRMLEVQTNEVENNRRYFIYNFSAFLSASRSVLQYMWKEIDRNKEPTAKQAAKKWLADRAAASPVLGFFKGKRDINIHATPVMPIGHIVAVGSSSVTFRYSFDAKLKPEGEVPHLCRVYLEELESLISEGISMGHITG